MTLLFDKSISGATDDHHPTRQRLAGNIRNRPASDKVLDIAIINNMPDPALLSTEKQFARLLTSSPEASVRVSFYSLPSIIRSGLALERVQKSYGSLEDLKQNPVDGLIVTGAEPRAAFLPDEPFWDDLVDMIDWAVRNTRSTIWSCLAAHAAVQHLDHIERRRMPVKKSGVFQCDIEHQHWLTEGMPSPLQISHSRWNELVQGDLEQAGYRTITSSPSAGVDIFCKSFGSEFVFFQGHPEYDYRSLQYEYLRDFGRYVSGEQSSMPGVPSNYFDTETEQRLLEIQAGAGAYSHGRYSGERPATRVRPDIDGQLSTTAEGLFSNWLQFLAQGQQRSAS